MTEDLEVAMQTYRQAADAADAARDEAYAAIRKASASGRSLRQIAERTGLSHQRIAQVLTTDTTEGTD